MPSRTCSWVNILVAPRTTLLLINQILGLGLHLLKFQSPSISARKTKRKLNVLCLLPWTHLIKLYCFESWTLYLFLTALVWMTGHHWLRVQQKLMQTSLLYCPKVRNAKITLCLKSWRTIMIFYLRLDIYQNAWLLVSELRKQFETSIRSDPEMNRYIWSRKSLLCIFKLTWHS